jgi:hypothetical protein
MMKTVIATKRSISRNRVGDDCTAFELSRKAECGFDKTALVNIAWATASSNAPALTLRLHSDEEGADEGQAGLGTTGDFISIAGH